jgi:hypothetical protein
LFLLHATHVGLAAHQDQGHARPPHLVVPDPKAVQQGPRLTQAEAEEVHVGVVVETNTVGIADLGYVESHPGARYNNVLLAILRPPILKYANHYNSKVKFEY